MPKSSGPGKLTALQCSRKPRSEAPTVFKAAWRQVVDSPRPQLGDWGTFTHVWFFSQNTRTTVPPPLTHHHVVPGNFILVSVLSRSTRYGFHAPLKWGSINSPGKEPADAEFESRHLQACMGACMYLREWREDAVRGASQGGVSEGLGGMGPSLAQVEQAFLQPSSAPALPGGERRAPVNSQHPRSTTVGCLQGLE